VEAAASNNVHWCDLVCRTHGITTQRDAVAWTSQTRTPALYPDAVTLVPTPSLPDLLDRIDLSPGCSIKDSFASMDLTTSGFTVLLDAQWIVRTAERTGPITADRSWTVVGDEESFAAWELAWRGEQGQPEVLSADLLREPSVTVLGAGIENHMAAGAILCRSGAVVGISNFFTNDRTASIGWPGCLALATSLFPGGTFVGYESGGALRAATRDGFDAVGPLRVWLRED
jgi:hypothetical protein